MQITRRNALVGATAAAVTGLTTAPLAIKAGAVKAALAGEPLVALETELIEARVAGERAAALWGAAYDKAGAWAFGWPRVDFSTPAMAKMRGWYERNSWPERERVVALDEIREFNRHTEKLVFGGDEVLAQRKAEGRERIRWWIKTRRVQKAVQEAALLMTDDPKIHRGAVSQLRRYQGFKMPCSEEVAVIEGAIMGLTEAESRALSERRQLEKFRKDRDQEKAWEEAREINHHDAGSEIAALLKRVHALMAKTRPGQNGNAITGPWDTAG